MKPFTRNARPYGCGIATSNLGSNITLRPNFDFTHTSFKVVRIPIATAQYYISSACTALHLIDEIILLTMLTEQLPDFYYINNLQGLVACLVGDMS